MAIPDDVIKEAVERYERERDRYIKLAARVADICRVDIVEANAIRAQVTSRTKSTRSFREKLQRFARRKDKDMPTVQAVFDQIGDLAGVRVATYRREDEKRVTDEIRKRFCWLRGDGKDIEVKDKLDLAKHNFYRATHCQAALQESDLIGDYENLKGASCEIQICSMMAHVWNEVEHDIGYKPEGGGPAQPEKVMLSSLGHLTRAGDEAISALLDATFKRLEALTGPFNDVHDFVARLRAEFPADVDLSANAGQLFDVVKLLGLASPEKLRRHLDELKNDRASVVKKIEEFNEYLDGEYDDAYMLDEATSDLLFVLLLERSARQIEAGLPAGRGMGRPSRARSVATRYQQFKSRSQQRKATGKA